ncbi:hypothetical protein I316_07551 [Kwoniella heveanensis BCC8398]|uniref:RNA-binding protein n=1 Tax=Kwoniella heveanensis BCC8398 TaxID=1296120 RepID=A0A1B9GIM0_9TREE|nr:hypothetical protein I316_07551 [Kwoniella heveanensis BCC8398]
MRGGLGGAVGSAGLPPRPFDDRDRPLAPSRRSPPPRGRYDDYPPPPPRRYDDDYPPPPRRYEDTNYPPGPPPPPPRRYDDDFPASRYREDRYVPPPSREPRGYGYDDHHDERNRRGRYEDRDRPLSRQGMMADREELRPRRDLPRRDEPQWERGRDVDELAAYDNDYQSGQQGRRGPKTPSEPSKHVIFLGLDQELSESDFSGFLRTEHKAEIDNVKIVRDKITGNSKCFGFAQFSTVEAAEEFININHPAVLMPALYAHSEPRKVKIDFSSQPPPAQPSGQREQPAAQTYTPPPMYARPAHDGMRDISTPGDGNRVLLLRGLDSNTTAKEIIVRMSHEVARMMGRTGQEAAAESTIVRVILIVDRFARSSWGYAFVELSTAELASAMLPFLLTPQHQPNGFIINHVPVAASFANPDSFVPVTAGPLGGEFIVRPSRNGGLASSTIDKPEGQWCAYWHQQAGAVETVPRGAPLISENGIIELTPDHRTFLGVLAGVPPQAKLIAPSIDLTQTGMAPINIGGGLQPIKFGGSKGKKKEEIAMIPISGKNLLGDEEEEVDLIGKDTIAKNISKWNTKQNELAAPEPTSDLNAHAPPKGISDVNATLGVKRSFGSSIATNQSQTASPTGSAAGPSKSPQSVTDDFDYTDVSTLASTGKVACLLCQRQFKTDEILRKHVAQSDLHKTNLADANARDAGQRRKLAVVSSWESNDNATKYRDRAAERREAFNQPSVPIPSEAPSYASQQEKKRKYAEGPKPPPPPPPPGLHPGEDDSNVGNQMLAKMGWTAGTGLGKEREGRVDPILVQQFENRAGLGASKGVEAGKWSGPGGFQQRALDMVSAF